MGRRSQSMRRAFALLAAVALSSLCAVASSVSAAAKDPGPNGRIVFSTVVDDDNTLTYTVNPDGSDMQPLYSDFSGFPRWSPDGSQVLIEACCDAAATLVDPDTGSSIQFTDPYAPTFFYGCVAWSSDAQRLGCFGWSDSDPSLNGAYTIRSSDGGGLTRVTSNPFGGTDYPGDFSPDGTRFVFARNDPTRPKHAEPEGGQRGNVALFVVNTDGRGVHRITPWGLVWNEDAGRWSPDGNNILFDNNGSLYVVHPDGTGLRKIPLLTRSTTFVQNPDWSPDGTKIVFSLATSTGPGTFQSGIYTANADGTDLQRITNPVIFDRYADWGPGL